MQVDLIEPKIVVHLTVDEALTLVDDIDENDSAVSTSTLFLGHRLGEMLENAGYLDGGDDPEPTPPADTTDPAVRDWAKVISINANGRRLA